MRQTAGLFPGCSQTARSFIVNVPARAVSAETNVWVSVTLRDPSAVAAEALENVTIELNLPRMPPNVAGTGAVPTEPVTFTSGMLPSATTFTHGSRAGGAATSVLALAGHRQIAAMRPSLRIVRIDGIGSSPSSVSLRDRRRTSARGSSTSG